MCLHRCGHVLGKGVCLFLRARVKGKGVCHFVGACAASSSQDFRKINFFFSFFFLVLVFVFFAPPCDFTHQRRDDKF
jgi:hypothetical protein